MTTQKKAFEAIVKGRVQGVSFRYYTKKKADELGVTGEVKNLSDGTVFVRAEASDNIIKEFQNFISTGPTLAHVEEIELNWYHEFKNDKSFHITY